MHMKKVFLLLCCVVSFWPVLISQKINQSVIASDGGIARGDELSLEWTLGEFAVESIISGKHLYTQGFHQPVLIVKSINAPPVSEQPDNLLAGYSVQLAPNPVRSIVTVYIGAENSEKFSLSVYDLNGKRIAEKQVTGTDLSVRFEMQHLASGVYLLDVRNSIGLSVKAFKVIKAD